VTWFDYGQRSTCRYCGEKIRLLPGQALTSAGESVDPWTTGEPGDHVQFVCSERVNFLTGRRGNHEPAIPSLEQVIAELREMAG
jgi:hypothetical protein